ncbi:probable G-protein coupled receptor 139 [Narcine bancroftii]|uniref:probable G-protein coupled receptor 139 n=1 Tax=Narcine bancroftii TaxID=1343680 RepID=UPI00383100CE
MLEIFNRFKKIYYLMLFMIGVPVNLVAIVILSRGKCGLSSGTTHYLVAMAASDLLSIITEVFLWRISYYYFPGSFLDITPVCSVILVLSRASTNSSVWFTVAFTFDRFVAICCQKLKVKYCTKRTAIVVLGTTGCLLFVKNIPWYFTLKSWTIIDNVPWGCYNKPGYYSEPGWVGFDWFDTVLTPLLPFALILLFNALTVRHIIVASRVREGLKKKGNTDNRNDPEMESRRRSIILLFALSGSFILLWMVYVLYFIYYTITGKDRSDFNESENIFRQAGTLLLNLNCCINTFVYVVTQSKFRDQLRDAVKYPIVSFVQWCNSSCERMIQKP